jgi:uncharacterized protein (UPF0335 family)
MSDNQSLGSFIDRICNLEREKRQIGEIIAETKNESKSAGFDPGAITDVVRRILADESKREKAKAREDAARMYAESIGQASLF